MFEFGCKVGLKEIVDDLIAYSAGIIFDLYDRVFIDKPRLDFYDSVLNIFLDKSIFRVAEEVKQYLGKFAFIPIHDHVLSKINIYLYIVVIE